jgi:hypothetical protein
VSVLFQNAVWAVCIQNAEVGSDLEIVVSIDVIVLKLMKASFIKKNQGHSDFAAFSERQRIMDLCCWTITKVQCPRANELLIFAAVY